MQRVHIIGIGGIGLSAIAQFLKNRGYDVSGSDLYETTLTKKLAQLGIKITVPHSKDAINNQDIIIYSAVIKQDNPELLEAKKQNIKIYSRKEFLPYLLKEFKVYSVCGAHGKSTTTAILNSILKSSALIGAESKEFNSNFTLKDGNLLTFEADESDGSFLNSNPYCAVVTNAEPEHMEYYEYNYEKFYNSYHKFLSQAKIRVINAEDTYLSTVALDSVRLYPSKDITNIRYEIIDNEPTTIFTLKELGEFKIWGFGKHMAIDASLAILAALHEMDLETIRKNIKNFKGIKKRFDILQNRSNFVLIDDYGHHPTEIKATLEAAKL